MNRQEIDNEITRLEGIQNPTQADRIKLTRSYICERYIKLMDEKNEAIDLEVQLSFDYDRKLLILIRDILEHTRNNWQNENHRQRKGSLQNIIRSVLLLRKKFTVLYNTDYANLRDKSAEINLWRNVGFLIRYQLTHPDQIFTSPLPINTTDANDILRELFVLLERNDVLNQETRIGLRFQSRFMNFQGNASGLSLPEDIFNRFQSIEDVRNIYRKPYALPFIEAFSMHGREKLKINRILESINFAIKLDVNNDVGKMALLRHFQVVGESVTGKNFSSNTKCLIQDVDWQLLVQLRNKLSHNEWDIHSNFLQAHLTSAKLQAMQQDLTALQRSVSLLQRDHNGIGNAREQMLRHYDPSWRLRPKTHLLFMDFIRDCYIVRIINDRAQLIEIRNLLITDIRETDLLGAVIRNLYNIQIGPLPKDVIQQVFGTTRHLLPQYEELRSAFSKEISYYKNLENPNRSTQKKVARRLALHQINIRSLNNLLSYTENTYNQDRQVHRFSFNSFRLIGLIEQEITAIQNALTPLDGSQALNLEYPEDATAITDSSGNIFNIIEQIFPQRRTTMQRIKTYCNLMRRPLYINLDGLHGVNRGEMHRLELDFQDLLQKIRASFHLVRIFSEKCFFYSSLVEHPEIVEACFYRMARIQKYVVVLKLSQDFSENQLPNVEELKALRNFIHHQEDFLEKRDIGTDYPELMTRYASIFINKLLPSISKIKNDIVMRRPALNALLLHHGLYSRRPSALFHSDPSTRSDCRDRILSV